MSPSKRRVAEGAHYGAVSHEAQPHALKDRKPAQGAWRASQLRISPISLSWWVMISWAKPVIQ